MIRYGADYNPEHWTEDVWDEDVKLMTEAGVNLVSLGIFSWAKVEPRPGEFDFGWVDAVMDKLAAHGIGVSLSTMTASPPPWLSHRHPEVLPVREDGTRLSAGSRQQYCPSSPVYRDHAARLVEQVAARYGDHPALTIWHVGNEYGCHIRQCYCDTSAADFRTWLRARYGTLDALNAAWSTTFWSQGYSEWAEIQPPRVAPSFRNPAQQLDFQRFSSDAILACYRTEADILRRVTPGVPLTTNFVGLVQKALDWHSWAAHEDVVSLDSYPEPYDPRGHVEAAFGYDVVRSLKDGKPWLLLEHAPSAVNWRTHNGAKAPGVMRQGVLQAVARGADAALFFQWRQSRGGAEKFHSAMVPHAGADTRIFAEVCSLGQDLAALSDVAGTRVRSEVAFLHDWNSWWALELDAHPSQDVTQLDSHLAHYAPFFDAGVSCDVLPPTGDLSAYKLVVVPNLYLLDEEVADGLRRYVESGGHLVVSFFSGIVDSADRAHLGGYPVAPLREALGVRVEEFWPLAPGTSVALSSGSAGTLWSEAMSLQGAEVVASFASGDLAGAPAITRHEYGDGVAWYLGTRPEPGEMRRLVDRIAAGAGVAPVLEGLPAGVQAVRREGPDREFLFLLNHDSGEVAVDLPSPAPDLLTGRTSARHTLAPRGVAVVRIR
ncbi:beta-galactosidase [Amycolatopsis thermophila]|uniref:Beta-galactosidase n=1 Tax=Amycolatopsis thermophila TaxID=206084 RepID=A0ABU0EWK8_9PSEU|nr:beta-galactosidase [Amycolatopsis thermophila]MDQ0379696.1 beta-galactosidase [Amycolatopsis thermophila]